MKLLEYQAKEQFAGAGIPVKEGRVARTVGGIVEWDKTSTCPTLPSRRVPLGSRAPI